MTKRLFAVLLSVVFLFGCISTSFATELEVSTDSTFLFDLDKSVSELFSNYNLFCASLVFECATHSDLLPDNVLSEMLYAVLNESAFIAKSKNGLSLVASFCGENDTILVFFSPYVEKIDWAVSSGSLGSLGYLVLASMDDISSYKTADGAEVLELVQYVLDNLTL